MQSVLVPAVALIAAVSLLTGTAAGAAAKRTVQPRQVQPINRSITTQENRSLQGIKAVPFTAPTHKATKRAGAAPPLYDLPFFANDLGSGERYYRGKKIHSESGSQQWGYDLGAMRLNGKTNRWSEVKPGTNWKKITNASYYVYGKRVYAMGPGTVIRCWRNAPENPRPFSYDLGDRFDEPFAKRDWLHQAWRNLKMPGGGNHLLVRENDGDLILYAHAPPGAISTTLCPHNNQLYSKAENDGETNVPAAQQAKIKAGQYLFRVGNSGNSSAPHLHVHLQDPANKSLQLRFRRGLSTPLINWTQANINTWTSFAGKRIPDGPVLFWPPRRLGKEYARHGYPAKDFQRLFDHLADSGFWPEWIDAYSVGGRAYLNHVWRPAKGAWRAYFLLTPQDYQKRFNQATNAKYAPVFVESSLVSGHVRYTAIFVKNKPGGALARHGLTYNQHMQVMEQAKKQQLNPVNISVVSVNGTLRYTVLYRAGSIGTWQVKSRVPSSNYQQLYTQNANAKRRPLYVNAYMHKGKPYYTVVFSQKPTGKRKDRHGMSAGKYQQEFNSAHKSGLLTRAVSGYDGAKSHHRFIAIWRK